MQQVLTKALSIATALTIGLAGASTAHAQAKAEAGHSHAAPHGGEVMGVGSHHVEFKADSSGAIQVWLLDGKEKPVDPPADGSVTLMGSGDNQVTLPLAIDKVSQRLHAKFDAKKFATFQAVVSMTIEGKRQNLRFRYPHR